jgi:hypothetical protein
LWLFWEFIQSYILCIVYRDDRGDPYEIESIANLRSYIGEGEFATTILGALSDICDIPDRLTIEILQFYEVEEDATSSKGTNISDDIRESGIHVRLIEFAMEREDFYTSIGAGFFDFELGKHKKRDRK